MPRRAALAAAAFLSAASTASASCAKCVKPAWTWDTLNSFIHTSNTSGLFNDEELDVLQQAGMVTIEKWQGVSHVNTSTGEYTDKKIIDQCRAIKERNPKVPCYMYWDTNTVWDCAGAGPPGFCGGRGCDNVAYVGAITANSAPEEYLLHKPNGSLYVSGYVNAHVIDFRKPAAAALWIETCTNATKTGVVDGCFADFCSWGLPDSGAEAYPGFTEAHHRTINDLTEALGPNGVAIGNNCQRDTDKSNVTSRPSAVFMEGFANTTGNFDRLKEYVNESLWPNKPIVQVHISSHDCWDRAKCVDAPGCNNTLAAAMVLMREGVYIGLGNWRENAPARCRLLPEFAKPLGAPDGPAVVGGDGVYTRTFASGTQATYDPATGLGSVRWASSAQ